MKPTRDNYETLQRAYDFFNEELFGGALPQCLITLQRKNKAMGYYSAARFRSMVDQETTTDEIALNPMHFVTAKGDMEIMQTLVHEMCHLWQHHFGKPSRNGYHNREWASKMESVGLVPSSTSRPGGKKTGQRMGDYAQEGGRFEQVFTLWAEDNHIEWADASSFAQLAAMMGESGQAAAVATSAAVAGTRGRNKQKFSCPKCGQNAWAKPSAKLVCGECIEKAIVIMEVR